MRAWPVLPRSWQRPAMAAWSGWFAIGFAPIAAAVAEAASGARIHVVDVDAKALDYARRNLPAGAHAHLGDGLSTLPPRLLGAVDVMSLADPMVHHAASSVIQAAREVSLFLAARQTGEETQTLDGFHAVLTRSPVTAASALGALVTGLVLIEALGLRGTTACAAAINVPSAMPTSVAPEIMLSTLSSPTFSRILLMPFL